MKVFTVHGIRRKHRWYENFEVLEGIKKNKIEILKFDFGFFTLWDFLRKSKRDEIIDKFCAFYSDKMLNSTVLPCAIGHSFGTYILFKAMQKYDVIKFDRVIFCGSILNSEIDFRELFENGQVKNIINDYGEREWFVGITRIIIDKNCGKAGLIGFKDIPPKFKDMFVNRKNYKSHSEYFLPLHMSQNWLPFITKSNEKFGFNEDIFRKEIIDRVYKNIDKSHIDYEINEVSYYARIDNKGNYYAKYEQKGLNNIPNKTIDSIIFPTSADGFHDSNKMNFMAYDLDSGNKLTFDVTENISFHKAFKCHLSNPVNYKETINTKFYFGWLNTMNLEGGDTDHFVAKDISNIFISINFPSDLKVPKIFELKEKEVVGQQNLQKKTETDGTITYFLKYHNPNNNDGLVFYFEGIAQNNKPQRKIKTIDLKIGTGKKSNDYHITEATTQDIRRIYKIESEIEMKDAADENTLELRRNMFNEGFLVAKSKKNGEVIGYLESVVWNEKPFQTFEEISNFPMHYNVNGDTLYVIFIAVSKSFRRKGVASKLIGEVEVVAKRYKVKKIRLVAKDGLVDFYSKFGFSQLSEMPAFLKGKPYRSVLMEKVL